MYNLTLYVSIIELEHIQLFYKYTFLILEKFLEKHQLCSFQLKTTIE